MNDVVTVEDALSTRAQKEQAKQADLPLYASRVKVHPKNVSGIFRRLKWAVLILLDNSLA